jgi:hypothetical protein
MAKPLLLKTLSEKDIAYVKKQKTLKLPGARARGEAPEKGPSKMQLAAQRRQKMHKIYEQARKEISDLTVLAEFLPEDQLNQIFTDERLTPLFNAILLSYDQVQEYRNQDPERLPPDQRPSIDKDLLEKKQKRLVPLCFQIISLLDNDRLSGELAGQDLKSVTALESSFLSGIRAIYYRHMIPFKKK